MGLTPNSSNRNIFWVKGAAPNSGLRGSPVGTSNPAWAGWAQRDNNTIWNAASAVPRRNTDFRPMATLPVQKNRLPDSYPEPADRERFSTDDLSGYLPIRVYKLPLVHDPFNYPEAIGREVILPMTKDV
jgi:hypothetical protein